jgi:hypothetical protein
MAGRYPGHRRAAGWAGSLGFGRFALPAATLRCGERAVSIRIQDRAARAAGGCGVSTQAA